MGMQGLRIPVLAFPMLRPLQVHWVEPWASVVTMQEVAGLEAHQHTPLLRRSHRASHSW